jgi:hypothetical protein
LAFDKEQGLTKHKKMSWLPPSGRDFHFAETMSAAMALWQATLQKLPRNSYAWVSPKSSFSLLLGFNFFEVC